MKLPKGVIVRVNNKSYKGEIPDAVCPKSVKEKYGKSAGSSNSGSKDTSQDSNSKK